LKGGKNDGKKMSSIIKCHNPSSTDAYGDISRNISDWIEAALSAPQG
jgi:hypothetical protein